MKFTDVNEALRFLSKHADIKVDGKLVRVKRAGGLKCLSALDYLRHHSDYNVVIKDVEESEN